MYKINDNFYNIETEEIKGILHDNFAHLSLDFNKTTPTNKKSIRKIGKGCEWSAYRKKHTWYTHLNRAESCLL